ncbi:MAG TPA: hypothetical protein VJ867_10755 [Gemmatimonadaceae bacterium]|nr:hypothetical protein [Gemmatimonadaceae bacterium]
MRVFRGVAVAALLALDVSVASAQTTRHFKDSWFWGLKGGALFYNVQSDTNAVAIAPSAGIDWMITRTNGGLYVSYDYAYFNQSVFVNDSVGPTAFTPAGRQVDLHSMHRFMMLGMLFPMPSYRLQPYLGLGAALSYIGGAEAQGAYANRIQQDLVLATISQFRASVTPHAMLGMQWRLPLISVFAQGVATQASQSFFLYTGGRWRTSVEAGARYNIGSSIDLMR